MSGDKTAAPLRPTRLGMFAWAMFDWSAQPYYTIIAGFIFGPYLVNDVIGQQDGMASWGYALAAGGFIAALCSPVFGAIADKGGRRKPWLLGFTVIYVLCTSLLWYAKPGSPVNPFVFVGLVVLAGIAIEFATVFTNAMLPDIVSRDHMGQLSGNAYALGYVGALAALIVLIYFILPDSEGIPHFPYEPEKSLFALDPTTHEPARAIPPFTAVWLVIFILPLFLFTPDRSSTAFGFRCAVSEGMRTLARTLVLLPRPAYHNLSYFLLARMLFNDGLTALYIFGMIYAQKILGWSDTERGITGILLVVPAAFGALIGGILDGWLGPKRTIIIGIMLLMAGTLGVASIGPDTILFLVPVAPGNEGPYLSTAREWTLLISSAVVGMGGAPTLSASRTMMARLSPTRQMTEAFGLFALSGRATTFLAPLAISIAAGMAGNRVAILTILAFLIGGLLLLLPVRLLRVPDFDMARAQ